MAKTSYTYKDFLNKATGSGLLDSFSEADLRLAKANPEAGMSLLSYKLDYQSAATDEARALANLGAERVRSVYGGYTAGEDGSRYYQNQASAQMNNYVNQYEDEQQRLIDALSGSFDTGEADRMWNDYRKAYLREGARAYENTLGSAAANTGGVASTAAVTAAQQAQNYYSAQAADSKAALYQQAYDNYLAGRAQAVSELGMYDTLNQTAAASRRQAFEDAMELWKAYGYVTAEIADALSLPEGTMYSEQAYNAWYQAFQEAASGVRTGKVAKDTVGLMRQRVLSDEQAQASQRIQLSRGSTGADVSALHQSLTELGYTVGAEKAGGVYGTRTAAAVAAVQGAAGLPVDGVCDTETWKALLTELAEQNG